MALLRVFFAVSTLASVSLVHGQGVILSAQGTKGSDTSLALQVDTTKADANIINQNEITTNVVNECGRTLLGGNIDIGENTELQLSAKTVTSVTKGSTVSVKINQGDANGAGPYSCDMDLTSNSNGISGQTPLDVSEKADANGQITLSVTMPSDLACTGASTGNVCTVRCFNNATTGPFGGCFAVQQTDITAKSNTPENIATAQTLSGIQAQVLQDQKDLQAALQAISTSGGTEADQGVAAVDALLKTDSKAAATVSAAAAAATTSAANTGTKGNGTGAKGKGNGAKANGGGAKANGRNGNRNKRQDGSDGRKMRWGKRQYIPSAVGNGLN